MITLTNPTLTNSGSEISWLFEVVGVTQTHRWSLKNYTYSGNSYTDRIIDGSFKGIQAGRKNDGLPAPMDLAFAVDNVDDTYAVTEFPKGNAVTVSLVLRSGDGSVEELIRSWKFKIAADPVDNYGRIDFQCKDLLQDILSLSWPKTPLISSLFGCIEDGKILPVVYGGGAYIPCPMIDIEGDAAYLLGEKATGETFTTAGGATPLDFGAPVIIANGDISQNSIIAGSKEYRYVLILGGQGWESGGQYLSPAIQYYRSTTSAYDPADVAAAILADFGMAVDPTTFDAASTELNARVHNVVFRGGWWYRTTAGDALRSIMLACGAELYFTRTGDIGWKIIDADAAATVSDVNRGSLKVSGIRSSLGDSGYVSFAPCVFPGQSRPRKLLVPAQMGGTFDKPHATELKIPFGTGDAESTSIINAKKAATLYFQRLTGAEKAIDWEDDLTACLLDPGDVVTLAEMYGGVDVVVDRIVYGADGKGLVRISAVKYSMLDEWSDLAAMPADEFTDPLIGDLIQTVTAGPDGTGQNVLRNRLRIGENDTDCIVFDPLDSGGDRIWAGNANPAMAGFRLANDGSVFFGDPAGQYLSWDAAPGTLTIAGFGGTEADLESGVSISSGGIAMSGTSSIRANKTTASDATAGFFIGPAGFSIGNDTNYLYWNGSALTVAGSITITNASSVRTQINVADGATAGATWGSNIGNQPAQLADVNYGEGTKLGGIETGADVTEGAIEATVTIMSGGIVMSSGGKISAAKTAPGTTTSGFWLGYYGGAYQFDIGDSTSWMRWDGTSLDIRLGTGGSLKVAGGGGLDVYGGDSTPGAIRFRTSAGNLRATFAVDDTNGAVYIIPDSAGTRAFGIGTAPDLSSNAFYEVKIMASYRSWLYANGAYGWGMAACQATSNEQYAQLQAWHTSSGNSGSIRMTAGSTWCRVELSGPTEMRGENVALGNTNDYWGDGYLSTTYHRAQSSSRGGMVVLNNPTGFAYSVWKLEAYNNGSNQNEIGIYSNQSAASVVSMFNNGSGTCNLWVEGDISGLTITDRSDVYTGDDAIASLRAIRPVAGSVSKKGDKWAEVDHQTLPAGVLVADARGEDGKPAPGRDIGAQLQMVTAGLLELAGRLEAAEKSILEGAQYEEKI